MATAALNIADTEGNDCNIVLTCCNIRKCHSNVNKIQASLHRYGYVVNLFQAHTECNIHVFKESASRAQCVLLIECGHIREITGLTYCFESSHLGKKTIVAGKSLKSKFEHCQRIKLKKPSDLDECVKAVMNKITKTIYGSTTVLNDYEDLDNMNSEHRTIYEGIKTQNEESLSETSLKRVMDPHEVIVDVDKKRAINVIQEDRFIHAETLEPTDTSKGPLILESFTKPKGKNENFHPTISARAFNRADGEELQETSKSVMSIRIPKLKCENNITELIDLLKLNDGKIQTKVTETLKLLQFESDIKSANVEQLFTGIRIALQIIEKRPANHSCISKIAPVVMNAISVLYLQTVIHYDEDEIVGRLRRESYSHYLRGLDFGDQSVEYQDLIKSLKTLTVSLEDNIGKKSYLQMGNWEEALRDDRNCQKLRKDVLKMPFIEQYAFVFGIVNQLCLKKIPLNLKIISLLKNLLSSLITRALNKKTESTLYSILVLATQSVVHLFFSLFREDGFGELAEILMLYLDNPKILQSRRWALLTEVEPLLFHKNTDVAKTIVKLFRSNGCTEVSVRKRSLVHIERLLLTSSLKILNNELGFLTLNPKPEWHSLNGTLCGAINVELNVLLPSQECLSLGCMNDYKRRADDSATNSKITSLEILLHLQKTGCHNNVVRLIAYQSRPMPLFYIKENFPGQNFQSFLLTKRKNQDWLSCTELKILVVDIVHALEYLHSKHVIHCDLTASSFSLTTDRRIVLTDLKIARKVDGENEYIYASDWLCKNVPTRWISPESILEDKYDRKTDLWMLGPLIYEIFTHGCHPYTELYNIETDKVLEWVVFHELKLRKWPCIPSGVQEIILSCIQTNPEERSDLSYILDLLNNDLASEKSPKRSRLSSAFSEDEWYPDLDLRQIRRGEPEKGIPQFFVGLKQSNETPRVLYFNIRASQRLETPNNIAIKEENLLSSDQPNIQSMASCLLVEEPVTEDYVEKVLPQISRKLSREMCIYSWPPDKRLTSEDQIGNHRILVYKCHKGTRLLDFAAKRMLGDPVKHDKYVEIILEIVNCVANLHTEDWIHRDISCRSLYITDHSKVFIPRLGRMCRMNPDMMSDNCILGPLYQDRINWMPIEVLQRYHCKQKSVCQYSKASDVYMLACTIYEFYTMLEIRLLDPMASELASVPFATLSATELLNNLYSGEKPPCPNYCPSWLYELLVLCWNRESSRRPTINFIRDKIKQRTSMENIYEDLESNSEHFPSSTCHSSDDYPFSTESEGRSLSSDEYYTPPALPPPRRGCHQHYAKENPIYASDSTYNGESFKRSDSTRPKSSKEIIAEIEEEDTKSSKYIKPSKDTNHSKHPTNFGTTIVYNGTKQIQRPKQKRPKGRKKTNEELCDIRTSECSDTSAYMFYNSPSSKRKSNSQSKENQDLCKRNARTIGCVNGDSDSSCQKKLTQRNSCQNLSLSNSQGNDPTPLNNENDRFEQKYVQNHLLRNTKGNVVNAERFSKPVSTFKCINSDSSDVSDNEHHESPKYVRNHLIRNTRDQDYVIPESFSRPVSKFRCINSDSSDMSDIEHHGSSKQQYYEDALSKLEDDYLTPIPEYEIQEDAKYNNNNTRCLATISQDQYQSQYRETMKTKVESVLISRNMSSTKENNISKIRNIRNQNHCNSEPCTKYSDNFHGDSNDRMKHKPTNVKEDKSQNKTMNSDTSATILLENETGNIDGNNNDNDDDQQTTEVWV